MQSIPVDVGRLTGLVCVSAPEVKVNPTTGEIRMDRVTGAAVYLVGVAVKLAGTRKASVIDVQVAGEPVGIVEGAAVRLFDLEAVPWEIEGRSGVSFRASAVAPAYPVESAPVRGSGKGGDA